MQYVQPFAISCPRPRPAVRCSSAALEVSRLVDVCRQSLVFDSTLGIAQCISAIIKDQEVAVLRIKNRLDPLYDSALSAGYRDVGMNLRIVTPEAVMLGVNAHVCEVQLLLRQFAELKVAPAQ